MSESCYTVYIHLSTYCCLTHQAYTWVRLSQPFKQNPDLSNWTEHCISPCGKHRHKSSPVNCLNGMHIPLLFLTLSYVLTSAYGEMRYKILMIEIAGNILLPRGLMGRKSTRHFFTFFVCYHGLNQFRPPACY